MSVSPPQVEFSAPTEKNEWDDSNDEAEEQEEEEASLPSISPNKSPSNDPAHAVAQENVHDEHEVEELNELEYSYGDSIPDEHSGLDAGFDDDDSLELP